jgi:hypothetical protein
MLSASLWRCLLSAEFSRRLFSSLQMEMYSLEMSVDIQRTTRRYVTEHFFVFVSLDRTTLECTGYTILTYELLSLWNVCKAAAAGELHGTSCSRLLFAAFFAVSLIKNPLDYVTDVYTAPLVSHKAINNTRLLAYRSTLETSAYSLNAASFPGALCSGREDGGIKWPQIRVSLSRVGYSDDRVLEAKEFGVHFLARKKRFCIIHAV